MRPIRIVAVDDDDDARGLARKVLENNAYEVEEADGADALFDILRSEPDPNAILLDLTLNGTSGWEILRSLKADRKHATVPVIVVSGRDDDMFRETAMELGACAYITKPYATQQLLQTVRAHVRGGRLVDPWAV